MTLTFKDSVAYGAESGIVILKKIPKGQQQQQQKSKEKGEAPSESSTIPEFKPLNSDDSDEYSFKNIVGKFFHASTSLQPDNIAPTTTTDDEIEIDVEALKKPTPDDVVYDDELRPSIKPSPSTFLANKKPNTFEPVNYETHPELYEDSKPEDEHSGSFKFTQKEIHLLKNYLINLKSNNTKSNFNPSYPREVKYGKPIEISASAPHFGGFKLNPPSNPFDEFKSNTIDLRYKRYPPQHQRFLPSASKPKIRFAPRPSKHFPAQRPPPVNLVKSVTYKLTPNGPIKVV